MPQTAEDFIQGARELPVMPPIAAEIMRKAEDPDTDLQSITQLISSDASLAVRVLRIANSSFYSMPRKIETLQQSILLLGYSTQWGDSAHAVNPLGDLYKHQVYQLARHLELPDEVVEKAPSADLFEGQTDEAELGFTYAEADRLLYLMVDRRFNVEELVAAGFDEAFVRSIAGRIVRNQFKRLPPVIAKLSRRTISHDFRYLRDWMR